MNLEHWRDFEHEQNPQDEEAMKKVAGLMPKRVKKRRKIQQDEVIISRVFLFSLYEYFDFTRVFFFQDAPGEENGAGGWEEFFDYIFPEDEGAKPNLKLLAMAKMWKKQKEDVPVVPATMTKNEPEENIGKLRIMLIFRPHSSEMRD